MYFLGNGNFAADDDALLTATRGLTAPNLIIFVTAASYLKKAALQLQKLYPDAQIMGGSGYTMQLGGDSRDSIQVVGFGDEVEVIAGIIPEISACPVSSVGSIIDNLTAIKPGTHDTICFQFSAGYGERIVTLFESVIRKSLVPMIGATTFDWEGNTLRPPAVSLNGIIYENACVYAFIKNKMGCIKIFRENIYKIPEGAPIHIASKADRNLLQLYELDAAPAADVYFNEIGFDRADAVSATMLRPLGRIIGDDVFVIALKDLKEDGTLVTHKKIGINDSIYILVLDDVISCVKHTVDDIIASTKQASMIVCINCAYRQALFEKMNFSETYCTMMSEAGPFACFVGGGEQGFGQNMNQSMICMVFE